LLRSSERAGATLARAATTRNANHFARDSLVFDLSDAARPLPKHRCGKIFYHGHKRHNVLVYAASLPHQRSIFRVVKSIKIEFADSVKMPIPQGFSAIRDLARYIAPRTGRTSSRNVVDDRLVFANADASGARVHAPLMGVGVFFIALV
jgi:hypothetical protein